MCLCVCAREIFFKCYVCEKERSCVFIFFERVRMCVFLLVTRGRCLISSVLSFVLARYMLGLDVDHNFFNGVESRVCVVQHGWGGRKVARRTKLPSRAPLLLSLSLACIGR